MEILKTTKKNVIFIIFFLMITYNFSYAKETTKEEKKDEYSIFVKQHKLLGKALGSTIYKLKKEKQLTLLKITIIDGKESIEKYSLELQSLNYKGPYELSDVRKTLIYAVDLYTDAINSDKKNQSYLSHYPFSNKDVQISIFFPDKSKGNTVVVSAQYGKVFYAIFDKNHHKKFDHQETYEESVNCSKNTKKDSYDLLFKTIQQYDSIGFSE